MLRAKHNIRAGTLLPNQTEITEVFGIVFFRSIGGQILSISNLFKIKGQAKIAMQINNVSSEASQRILNPMTPDKTFSWLRRNLSTLHTKIFIISPFSLVWVADFKSTHFTIFLYVVIQHILETQTWFFWSAVMEYSWFETLWLH